MQFFDAVHIGVKSVQIQCNNTTGKSYVACVLETMYFISLLFPATGQY